MLLNTLEGDWDVVDGGDNKLINKLDEHVHEVHEECIDIGQDEGRNQKLK